MKINITKYWERLWAEDLFAAIILEEDFDLDENGGCSLCYDSDIAARVCTPSELKRKHGGVYEPNSRETWLDVQTRALHQDCNRIRTICRTNGLYCKEA